MLLVVLVVVFAVEERNEGLLRCHFGDNSLMSPFPFPFLFPFPSFSFSFLFLFPFSFLKKQKKKEKECQWRIIVSTEEKKDAQIIALRNEQYPGRVLRMFNKTYVQGTHRHIETPYTNIKM